MVFCRCNWKTNFQCRRLNGLHSPSFLASTSMQSYYGRSTSSRADFGVDRVTCLCHCKGIYASVLNGLECSLCSCTSDINEKSLPQKSPSACPIATMIYTEWNFPKWPAEHRMKERHPHTPAGQSCHNQAENLE